ncbi:MAG: CsbD family protein [Candidatus Competibacteraceae bacterium]
MSSSTYDDVKGRVKEATGAVTGNDELKNEGKRDQAAGKIKETAEKVVDKVRGIAGGGDKEDKQ